MVAKTNVANRKVTVEEAQNYIAKTDQIRQRVADKKLTDADKKELLELDHQFNNNAPLRILVKYLQKINYSEKYQDDTYEYRYVSLSRAHINAIMASYANDIVIVPLLQLLLQKAKDKQIPTEQEWRGVGIVQSLGWVCYGIYLQDGFTLLFKRPLPK